MYTLETFTHETHPTKLHPDQRIRLVYDEYHETRGSYSYDTEEKTKAAEDHEIDMLERGLWVVLGRIVEKKCACCDSWTEEDSLWGITVENTSKGMEEAAFDV